MRLRVHAVVALFLLVLFPISSRAAEASEDDKAPATDTSDATQRLDSPLSPTGGVTFTSSRAKDALNIGLGSQLPGPFFFQLGVEGKLEKDVDSAPLFSIGSGASPGVTTKIGFGYSSFQRVNRKRHDGCVKVVQLFRDKHCRQTVADIAKGMSVPNAASADCAAAATELLTVVPAGLIEKNAVKEAARKVKLAIAAQGLPHDRFIASLQTELDALQRATNDKATDVSDQPNCSDAENSTDPEVKILYETEIKPHDVAGPDLRLSLNGLLETKGIKYQPVDASGAMLAEDSKTFVPALPGFSIDAILFSGRTILGAQVGYTRSVDAQYQEVCTAQIVGSLTARDCSQATVGKPRVLDTLFGAAALSINPLLRDGVGGLVPGAELLVQVASSNGSKKGPPPDLLASKSWKYVFTLPLFFAAKDAPWGLRAGLAPQLTVPTQDGSSVDFSVLLFVGTRFGQLAKP